MVISTRKLLKKSNVIADYVSDIHLDKYGFNNKKINFVYNKNTHKNLIIAGDLTDYNLDITRKFFDKINKNYKNILYVPGNHEYFNNANISKIQIDNNLKMLCSDYPNIYYLNNENITLDNIKYIGSTLWSKITIPSLQYKLTQFNKIYNNIGNITISDTNNWYDNSVQYIQNNINDDKPTIVVTHFSPLSNNKKYNVTHNRYTNLDVTQGFCNKLEFLIRDPIKIWIFGHTHYETNFYFNKVNVVSYPIGNLNNSELDFGNTIYLDE